MSCFNPELKVWTPELLKKKNMAMNKMKDYINQTDDMLVNIIKDPEHIDPELGSFMCATLQLNLINEFMKYQLTKDAEEFDKIVASVMTEEEAEKFYKELEEEESTKYNEPPEETKTEKDPCEGRTCYVKLKGGSHTRCDYCTCTRNLAERYHYFDCALKGASFRMPDKDTVNGCRIMPSAFNNEEETQKSKLEKGNEECSK